MDREAAKRLLVEGATFVLLGVPEGTEFGIDMKSWNTGENFRGVKMIPAGIHFVHYSAVNEESGDVAPRNGFLYDFRKGEFVVKKWDLKSEDVAQDAVVNATEVNSLRENLLALDRFLGPYPYDVYPKWLALTTNLTGELAKKLTPASGLVRSALDLVSCNDKYSARSGGDGASTSTSEATESRKRRRSRNPEALLPELKPLPGTELRLSKFPDLNYPEGSTPAQITQHSLDSTYVLETLLEQHMGFSDFIGEIQFAYVCFLIGHSLEAFEHWKELVGVVCLCDAALVRHRRLYDTFLTVLEDQMREIPEEFLADIVTNNNFIYCRLRTLFRNVAESSVDGRLKAKAARFRDALTDKYQWDFSLFEEEEEDGDEAPVIVHL